MAAEDPGAAVRRLICLWLVVLLVACTPQRPATGIVPELRLSPASFGASLSLTQRLTVVRISNGAQPLAAQAPVLDAVLEVTPDALQLIAMAIGQRLMTLKWDGKELQLRRSPMLPAEVDASHILRDVQLLYWPVEVIRSHLQPGWSLVESAQQRQLLLNGKMQVDIRYSDALRWSGQADLNNLAEGYRLQVESRDNGGNVP
ncbi:MAG: DUF3261 domain-containing protein [Rhodoferax sp.]|nr:DUF3261 domain-containing protein [Rhodoferax sp.]